ncbi:hypothetical protein PT282_01010 [Bifidobacterium sp. ESL0763]|uniref:hypothetical protein n=1 Tax=Bifidobacterium sp. ESL0763 TaxID=2983227 RepID=UPI0023F7799B|nr:hypothetical protein [Bifidobacterium sp. ESL0763]MDF7663262.1 hypothetical protein [Bifidobacterium sp. ESL0763]
MKYLASIIVTLFFAVAAAAFGVQLGTYGFAPPAQFVVMFFLLLFTALVWVAQSQRDKGDPSQPDANGLYYRTIADNSAFPIVGFVVQCVITVLYFCAWNLPLQNPLATSLKLVLPKGLFVPLVIELIIAVIVVVLWVGNNRANEHTVVQQQVRQQKIMRNDQLSSLVTLIAPRVDAADADALSQLNLIQEKVRSLPLNVNPATAMFYQQAMQELNAVAERPGTVDAVELRKIWGLVSQVR